MRRLLARAAARPDTLALVTPEAQLTWGELARRAAAVDHTLTAAGIGRGEAVALWLPNGVDWLIGFWGIVSGARVAVPLSTFSPPREVVRLLRHARARALFTTVGFARIDVAGLWGSLDELADLALVVVSAAGGSALPSLARRWEELDVPPAGDPAVVPATATDDDAEDTAATDDAIAVIQYTSGTTGTPKGAMLPAAGLVRAAAVHAADWRLAPGDALFVPNPFSHILGLTYGVVTAAAAGATTLTQAVFELDGALALLASQRAVAMTGAPTHLQILAEHPALDRFDLSALRLAMTGGAPLGLDWARRIRARLGLTSLVNGYGMSEVGSVAQTGLDDPPEVVASSVGTPMPGLEVRLVDPSGDTAAGGAAEDHEVGDATSGELWLRGPSVMRGYHAEPALTAAAFAPGGWLRTGDLLRRGADGRLLFVGRRADVISVGGFDVLAGDVETVLRAHPDVADAQVVGAPERRLGAQPVAFLRPATPTLAIADVAAFCRARLRSYMVPRRLVLVDAMPLTASGKVDRLALRRRAAAEVEG